MLCYLMPKAGCIEFWFSQGRPLEKSPGGLQFYVQGFARDQAPSIWSEGSFDKIEISLDDLAKVYESSDGLASGQWLSTESELARNNHHQRIDKAIKAINSGQMTKVVLSRVQEFNASEVDWLRLIWRLTQVDQNAFRYMLSHPNWGVWCGATPEVLLSVKDSDFSTMALAGTRWQSLEQFPSWTQKEYQEHDCVVGEILKTLKPFAQLQKGAPYNHQAGAMQHLRTDITGRLNGAGGAVDIARLLHPTPAVCGFPQSVAYDFIQQNEGYNRLLYTGFLGLFDPERNSADFYVNLRCLAYRSSRFHLYVGGGITRDSRAQNEWQETQRKMTTMGQVIAPFIE